MVVVVVVGCAFVVAELGSADVAVVERAVACCWTIKWANSSKPSRWLTWSL